MAQPVKLDENQQAWLRLATLTAIVERARNLELSKIGLNIPQAGVLYCVKMSKEPVTPMRLARMMHKQPHTVSALVHRMEGYGLVSTKKDMKRKNWLRVSLTEEGEEALKQWANANEVTEIMSCLTKKESEALYAITKKLRDKAIEKLRQMQRNPYDEPLFW